MKGCTTLNQAKQLQLTKINPEIYADMCYVRNGNEGNWKLVTSAYKDLMRNPAITSRDNIFIVPCYSTDALLELLPARIIDSDDYEYELYIEKSGEASFNVWYQNIESGSTEDDMECSGFSLCEACFGLLIKLLNINLI